MRGWVPPGKLHGFNMINGPLNHMHITIPRVKKPSHTKTNHKKDTQWFLASDWSKCTEKSPKKNIKPDLTFNVEFLKARTTKSLNRRAVAQAAAPGKLATTQSGVVDGRNTTRLAALVGSARTSAMANRTLPLEAWLEDAEKWQLYCKCECIIYSIYIEKKVLGKQSLLCTHFLCKCVCVCTGDAYCNVKYGCFKHTQMTLIFSLQKCHVWKTVEKTYSYSYSTDSYPCSFLASLIIDNHKQYHKMPVQTNNSTWMHAPWCDVHGTSKANKKQKDSTLMLTRCSYVCVHLKPDNGSAHCNTYATHCNSSFFTSKKLAFFHGTWHIPNNIFQHGSPTQLSHQLKGTTWMPSFEAQDDSNSPRGKGQHSKLFCFHTVST